MSTDENSVGDDLSPLGSQATSNRKLPLLVCCVAGLLIGYLFLGPILPETSEAGVAKKPVAPEVLPEKKTDLILPSKSLSPEQVVSAQMSALVDYATDRSAIHQVFAFASPANRAVTGPIERFEQMIRQGTYYSMVKSDYWMAGRAVARAGQATVLVTTIDANERVSLYRFYLSKQTDQYDDCWMTDRVLHLIENRQPPADENSSIDSI